MLKQFRPPDSLCTNTCLICIPDALVNANFTQHFNCCTDKDLISEHLFHTYKITKRHQKIFSKTIKMPYMEEKTKSL